MSDDPPLHYYCGRCDEIRPFRFGASIPLEPAAYDNINWEFRSCQSCEALLVVRLMYDYVGCLNDDGHTQHTYKTRRQPYALKKLPPTDFILRHCFTARQLDNVPSDADDDLPAGALTTRQLMEQTSTEARDGQWPACANTLRTLLERFLDTLHVPHDDTLYGRLRVLQDEQQCRTYLPKELTFHAVQRLVNQTHDVRLWSDDAIQCAVADEATCAGLFGVVKGLMTVWWVMPRTISDCDMTTLNSHTHTSEPLTPKG